MVADFDRALFAELRRDGRASYTDLARTLGVTRARVAARVHDLTASGRIRIVTVVDPTLLGLHTIAHVSATVGDDVLGVVDRFAVRPEVVFASAVSGAFDAVFEIRVPGSADIEDVVRHLRADAAVLGMDLLTYSSSPVGPQTTRPTPAPPAIDPVDLILIDRLREDARVSYRDLAELCGRSPSTVRARVQALLDSRSISIGAVPARDHVGGGDGTDGGIGILTGVGMRIGDRPISEILAAVLRIPSTTFAVSTFGRFDAVCTLAAPDTASLQEAIAAVRGTPGVRSVQTWVHLDVRKERYDRPLPRT